MVAESLRCFFFFLRVGWGGSKIFEWKKHVQNLVKTSKQDDD